MRFVAAAGLMLFVAVEAEAAKPRAKWEWAPNELGCALVQQVDAQGRVLRLSKWPGDERAILSLHDRQRSPAAAELDDASVTFAPSSGLVADVDVGESDKPNSRSLAVRLARAELTQHFAGATGLTISHPAIGAVQSPIRAAASAAQALLGCEDRKLRVWGVDPQAWRALRSKPELLTPTKDILSSSDYPAWAAAYGAQGGIIARVTVGADGSVKDCANVTRKPALGFTDAVCEAYERRARFKPGFDASGRPVEAPYIVRVSFRVANY